MKYFSQPKKYIKTDKKKEISVFLQIEINKRSKSHSVTFGGVGAGWQP